MGGPIIGIDIERITLRDALDLAVLIEEEARDRYREFAEQLATHDTPEVADFFARMARIEDRHRSELLERRRTLFGDAPSSVHRKHLFDVEAPSYDGA
ncbi:MAG TPA: ferritin family protein, partial [Myxococcaceae bacterium]|nr:ferritin family protein [Myxococcaceae bacterium]